MPLDASTAYYAASSPTLLASQAISDADKIERPGKDWQTIFTHLEARLASLRNWRWSWWGLWASLAEYILPRRFRWLITANTYNRGRYLNNAIVDETATQAMLICAAGCWTGLTSPSRPWFKFGVQAQYQNQLDAEGKAWIEDTEQKVYTVLDGSNFYTSSAQAFQDIVTFGTAPTIVYEHVERVIQCMLPCPGEYYLSVNSSNVNDVLNREFTMTVSAIVDMFGLDNCPKQIREPWAEGGGSLENEFVVAHSIEPNFEITNRGDTSKPVTVVPGTFPFREVYWLKGLKTEAELSRRGFNEQPFAVMRWSTTANDAYGRSPGMDVLGSTKQLQQETRRKGEFIEKLINPPMGADPSLKNEPASIMPGELTYADTSNGKKGFWPLFEVQAAALQPMVEDLTEIRQRIKDGFFVNIFMAISQMQGVQPRNELELTKRDLERLQVLGPFIELFETEWAGPILKRIIAIMTRRGIIAPRPASLRSIPVKIDFVSILRLAQRAAETATMERTFAVAGNLSAAAKAAQVPDPIRILNLDEALRVYGDMTNFPAKVMFSDKEVQEHDEQRAQAQQRMQAAQTTLPAVQAAKTLSETQVNGGQNALQAMLGGGGTQ